MKAKLLPLQGKYYGTTIEILESPMEGQEIKLWFDHGRPSDRELDKCKYTPQDWSSNASIADGWGGSEPIRGSDMWSDGHFERQSTYLIANAILKALNDLPETILEGTEWKP